MKMEAFEGFETQRRVLIGTEAFRRRERERGGGWRGRSRILKYLEMNIHIQKVRETKEQRMRGVAKEVGKK